MKEFLIGFILATCMNMYLVFSFDLSVAQIIVISFINGAVYVGAVTSITKRL